MHEQAFQRFSLPCSAEPSPPGTGVDEEVNRTESIFEGVALCADDINRQLPLLQESTINNHSVNHFYSLYAQSSAKNTFEMFFSDQSKFGVWYREAFFSCGKVATGCTFLIILDHLMRLSLHLTSVWECAVPIGSSLFVRAGHITFLTNDGCH